MRKILFALVVLSLLVPAIAFAASIDAIAKASEDLEVVGDRLAVFKPIPDQPWEVRQLPDGTDFVVTKMYNYVTGLIEDVVCIGDLEQCQPSPDWPALVRLRLVEFTEGDGSRLWQVYASKTTPFEVPSGGTREATETIEP